ncbi:hypothetical protein BD413DRAFT_610349 [Trametes elegans]|nr:hypothetical protein BD413DRAFT_610349 [Trametes elegans]
MSIAHGDPKFPGQRSSGLPPSPSRENPGQVFPRSDPRAAPAGSVPGTGGARDPRPDELLGNPYALEDAFTKLDGALSDVVATIAGEERSVGAAPAEDALVQKFKGWRDELAQIRSGRKTAGKGGESAADAAAKQREGGLFAD